MNAAGRENLQATGTLDLTLTPMRRDIPRLAETQFDLLIVGAGIFGACAAWDASLRGLSVAVVDQDDFGAATSANSLRIVHGGLRYLARGDFGECGNRSRSVPHCSELRLDWFSRWRSWFPPTGTEPKGVRHMRPHWCSTT